MSVSSEIRALAREVLSDGNSHGIDEIKRAVVERGIVLPKSNNTVRAALHFMKKRGELVSITPGVYKLTDQPPSEPSVQLSPTPSVQLSPFTVEELEQIRLRLESTIGELRKFDWISCSNAELETARKTAVLIQQIGTLTKRLRS